MKLYRVDMKVCATAYVKAKSKREVIRKAMWLRNQGFEAEDGGEGSDIISGLPYDDPKLPDVSLSPAMTIHGPWRAHTNAVEEVEESDE